MQKVINIVMAKKSTLVKLMQRKLPDIDYQKRLSYRTSHKEVTSLFKILNKEVFNEKLPTPKFVILQRTPCYWGMCVATSFQPKANESVCLIKIPDKWFCKQWLITILAHEMCHQYQYDIDGLKRMKQGLDPIMSHGPSFFKFKDKLLKCGISLKREHGKADWFKHQNLFKC